MFTTMKRSGFVMLVAVMCAVSLAPSGSSLPLRDGEDDGEKFAKALKLKLGGFKAIEGPSLTIKSRVAKITENTARSLGAAAFYRAFIPNPQKDQKVALTICKYPVEVKDAAAVLVAVDWSGICASAAVMDENDVRVDAWSTFTSQLVGKRIPILASARPRFRLEELKQQARTGKDKKSKLLRGLLTQREVMQSQFKLAGEMGRTLRGGGKVKPSTGDRMSAYFRSLAELKPMLEESLGKSAESYFKIAEEASTHFARLKPAIEADDIGKITGLMQESRKLCGRCHKLRDHALGPHQLDTAMGMQRQRLGIGHGYYLVGHDLTVLRADPAEAQHVADALWVAVLLTDPMLKKG